MKKKTDFIKDRFVRIPMDLTTDPLGKQGHVGQVLSVDQKQNIVEVMFDSDTIGRYDLDCIQIMHSKKTLMYHLSAKIKELDKREIDAMRHIIKLVSIGEYEAAFNHTLFFDENFRRMCFTDAKTYCSMKRNIRKHLGIKW